MLIVRVTNGFYKHLSPTTDNTLALSPAVDVGFVAKIVVPGQDSFRVPRGFLVGIIPPLI
jgi:hypothetical protein